MKTQNSMKNRAAETFRDTEKKLQEKGPFSNESKLQYP